EFFKGDKLIRANRQLAGDLDGVYHRGEIYLRWLQRFSSLFFANPLGRLLTLYLLLPVAIAFFALKFIEGICEELKFAGVPKVELFNVSSLAGVSVFVLLMIHVRPFRKGVVKALTWAWRGVRGLVYDLPAAVLHLPAVRAFLRSRPYLFFFDHVLK